jgi:protein gp37
MTKSKIEWTDRSDWNPIRGCTRVSPGCGGPGPHGGCYAEAIASRFSGEGQPFHGYAERTAKGPRWTGKVDVMWDRLTLPLRWRMPARIFASSTSDFFHAALPIDSIAQLFGVMIAAHHVRGHTFQVLTKRAGRMREMMNDADFWDIANAEAGAHVMGLVDPANRRSGDARAMLDDYDPHNPPPGIWLGVSVEDQQRADERIPDLLATPAAIRFLSCEPLLGPIDLTMLDAQASDKGQAEPSGLILLDALTGVHRDAEDSITGIYGNPDPRIDWVIAGGESGPNARPCHIDWARSLRDQCAEAGVPFLFKQWGEWGIDTGPLVGGSDPIMDGKAACAVLVDGAWQHFASGYGAPIDLCVCAKDFVYRLGKKLAGRLLDGREHNGFPEVHHG